MSEELFRIFLGFFVLLLLTRLIGKKQLGQLNVFTYITGMAMGNMAGAMILHPQVQIRTGVLAMSIWVVLIYLVEYLSLKFGKLRNILDGQPTIVIKKGLIQHKELKKLRLNIDDLTMLLRTNQVFSITEVDYAILEPNGDLSVLHKNMNMRYLPGEIIAAGKIVEKNLKELGKTKEWLEEELKAKGINSTEEVIYAEIQSDGELYVQKKIT